VRKALRLDDPTLNDLIWRHGESLRTRPWSTPYHGRDDNAGRSHGIVQAAEHQDPGAEG
jgi:hypothetical protein